MKHFERIGGFSADEVKAFLEDLRDRARDGRYFCSRTYFSFYGARPEEAAG
jgi:hypothetical protein